MTTHTGKFYLKSLIPNWSSFYRTAKDTLFRFPWAILSGVGCAITLNYNFGAGYDYIQASKGFWVPLLAMGIPIGTLVPLLCEGKRKSRLISFVVTGLSLLSVISLISLSLDGVVTRTEYFYRTMQFNLAIHLAFAFLPVWGLSLNAFWQFNRFLFWRLCYATLASSILGVGLLIALSVSQYLLFSSLPHRLYTDIFEVVCFIFHPWFFLSSIPKHLSEFDKQTDYPKGTEVIARNFLQPLMTLYQLILYLYLAKILFTQTLPRGGVGYLVVSFSIFGIFTFLFLDPLTRTKESDKFLFKRRIFYFSLIPLLGLLFVGLFTRFSEYGLTTNRYVLLVAGIWLLGISLYLLLSKEKNIRTIPISLAALALVFLFGPWSFYRLPPRTQMKVVTHPGAATLETIVSALTLIADSSERKLLYQEFPNLKTSPLSSTHFYSSSYELVAEVKERLKLGAGSIALSREEYSIHQAHSKSKLLDVGFEKLGLALDSCQIKNDFLALNDDFTCVLDKSHLIIYEKQNVLESLPLTNFLDSAFKNRNKDLYFELPKEKMKFSFHTKKVKGHLELNSFQVERLPDQAGYQLKFLNGYLFFTPKAQ